MVALSSRWKGPAADDGFWIVQNESACDLGSETHGNNIASLGQNRFAVFMIMSVGRKDMHRILLKQPQGSPMRGISPESGH
jgi:hypothetical protein